MWRVRTRTQSLTSSSHPLPDDYLKWRIFHSPPFWSDPPNAFDMGHPPPSIPSTIVRGDYTPLDQYVGQRYVPPSCLWYLLIHFALALVMVLLHPRNAAFISPLMALIPLVGTIYVFNLRTFRQWKIPNFYWNLVQFAGHASFSVCPHLL